MTNLYNKIKENLILTVKVSVIVFVALGVGAGINYALAQFSGPTGAPPTGDIDPPINTGTFTQLKKGVIGAGFNAGPNATAFLAPDGKSGFGIGLSVPEATVHIKKPALGDSPALRIETGQENIAGMVLKAADNDGNTVWAQGGAGGAGTYKTRCGWSIGHIASPNQTVNPAALEFPPAIYSWPINCTDADGTDTGEVPPACAAGYETIASGIDCKIPSGIALDTSLAVHQPPGDAPYPDEVYTLVSRNLLVGWCERTCVPIN